MILCVVFALGSLLERDKISVVRTVPTQKIKQSMTRSPERSKCTGLALRHQQGSQGFTQLTRFVFVSDPKGG